jgi:hypothetical protein
MKIHYSDCPVHVIIKKAVLSMCCPWISNSLPWFMFLGQHAHGHTVHVCGPYSFHPSSPVTRDDAAAGCCVATSCMHRLVLCLSQGQAEIPFQIIWARRHSSANSGDASLEGCGSHNRNPRHGPCAPFAR